MNNELDAADQPNECQKGAPEYTLKDLLEASPSESVELTEEDCAWLHEPSVGRESGD